jgi:DNA (cytosine-5)-methyltransferase 1
MKLNVIELFAGAAGLAQGFERTKKYNTVALYDIFEPARTTYLENYPTATYKLQDVNNLKPKNVLEVLDGRELHGILGGPPCQGFSLVGKRVTESYINQLVIAYARVVEKLQPHFLVMENVPQLMFHPLFKPLIASLQKNYLLEYAILNAARYGAPQTRHRLFIVAYHKQCNIKPNMPLPTHGKMGQMLYAYHLRNSADRIPLNIDNAEMILGADQVVTRILHRQYTRANNLSFDLKPLVTVGDALHDLPTQITEGQNSQPYSRQASNEYQQKLRGERCEVANNVSRQHSGKVLELARRLREGGTPQSRNSSRNKRYYSQAYGRLHRAGLARTITTFFQNAGSGRFIHYSQPRTLTIREAARLQGFSDNFVFYGSLEDQMQLVGNAVPLPLAEAIGKQIVTQLKEAI